MIENIRTNLANKKMQLSLIVFSLIFGFIYSIALTIREDAFSFYYVEFIVSSFLMYIVVNLLLLINNNANVENKKSDIKKVFIVSFVVNLFSYILCLLTFFPGVGMNDSLNILDVGMSISTQHSFYYVLFVRLLKVVGTFFNSMQLSIALYSTIQIFVCSFLLAGINSWLWTKNISKVAKTIVVIFYAFCPILCIFSISMLKDTVFSLFTVVMLVLIYELIDKKNIDYKFYWIMFVISSMAIAGLRNNGPYIIVITLIVLLIKFKNYRKQLAIAILSSTLIIISSSFFTSRYGSGQIFREAVGIPLQQISATVCDENGEINENEKEFINNIITIDNIKKQYNPYIVDDIKFHNFNSDYLQEHKLEFIKVWATLLPKNFGIYVKSYLRATYYFWAPIQDGFRTQYCVSICQTAGSERLENFILTSDIKDSPMIKGDLYTLLKNYYGLAYYSFYEGIHVWILAISAIVLLFKRKKVYLICYVPMLVSWLTIMISTPQSASLRYIFAFVYGLPLFVLIPYIKENETR